MIELNAASAGWLDISKLLLAWNPDPLSSSRTYLRMFPVAVNNGWLDLVRLVIPYDLSSMNLSYALRQAIVGWKIPSPYTVRYLIQKGPTPILWLMEPPLFRKLRIVDIDRLFD